MKSAIASVIFHLVIAGDGVWYSAGYYEGPTRCQIAAQTVARLYSVPLSRMQCYATDQT